MTSGNPRSRQATGEVSSGNRPEGAEAGPRPSKQRRLWPMTRTCHGSFSEQTMMKPTTTGPRKPRIQCQSRPRKVLSRSASTRAWRSLSVSSLVQTRRRSRTGRSSSSPRTLSCSPTPGRRTTDCGRRTIISWSCKAPRCAVPLSARRDWG